MSEQGTSAPPPPMSFVEAVSAIQEYYVVEKSGQPLQKEFFTLKHVTAFANVGITSALRDSVIWILTYVFIGAAIFYVQETYLQERATQLLFWQVGGSPLYWFAKLASFGGMAFSTFMCCWMASYYTGTVPKKAANTLFITRAMFLLAFALVSFVILGLLYKYLMNDDVIRKGYTVISKINEQSAQKFYYFMTNYFRRALFEAGIISLVSAVVSIVIPLIAIMVFKYTKQRKKDLGIEVSN